MKKKLCVLCLLLSTCLGAYATDKVEDMNENFVGEIKDEQKITVEKTIILVGEELTCRIEGLDVGLLDKAYKYKNRAYLSVDDILPAMGYTRGWDDNLGAFTCTKDGVVSYILPAYNNMWVGPVEYVFNEKPVIINNRLYVSQEMFTALTGYSVEVSGELQEYTKVTLLGEELKCYVNDEEVLLKDKSYMHKNQAYLSVDDILPALGYVLGWDSNINAVTCTKDGIVSYVFPALNNMWVGPTEYVFEDKPLIISNRAYISDEMFTTLTGCEVIVNGRLANYKNGRDIYLSVRNDSARLAGNSVVSGGGVSVIDGFGMELVSITNQNAKNYAAVINSVAASLDSNINVYNMIVPTAAEYYAPVRMYPNQLSGIQTVYANLSDRVIPVNVYDVLAEKTNEKIYFKTDHHWTQRGAYYAYKEFMEYQNITVPGIENFQNVPSYKFVGSFAGFASGTYAGTIMKNSPELLERFVPNKATTGMVYYDQNLNYAGTSVNAVSTNTNAYYAFIGGDNPITIFNTTAQSDKTLVIIKESFGNALATWVLNDYKRVCVIDPRRFNGFAGYKNTLNLNQFCRNVGATDVLFINYPVAVSSAPIRASIQKMR